MKKLLKVGIIAGFFLILAGVGVSAAAFALGADTWRISRFVVEKTERWNSRYYEGSGNYVSYKNNEISPEDSYVSPDDGENWEREYESDPEYDSAFAASEYVTETENGWEASYFEVSRLEIDQMAGNVDLYVVDGQEEMTIRSETADFSHVRFEENERFRKVTVRAFAGENYEIYIPAGWSFEKFEVEVNGGVFNGESIDADKSEYQAENGAVLIVSQEAASEVELDCQNAGIQWNLLGELPSYVEADCENGSIDIMLPAEQDTTVISYKVEGNSGYFNLPDYGEMSGAVFERSLPAEGGELAFFELSADRNGAVSVIK